MTGTTAAPGAVDPPDRGPSGPAFVPHPTSTREILALATPALLSGVVQMGYHWVNQAWVGRLPAGTTATAALSVAVFLTWALHAVGSLFVVGASAVVGRYVGALRDDAAGYVGSQGVRWALALGVVAGGIGTVVAPLVYGGAGVSAEAVAAGTRYTRIVWAGAFAVFGQVTCDAIWRAHGNTRVPLFTSALGLVLNAVLDPFLLYGGDLQPEGFRVPGLGLGLAGAATATVLASAVAFAVSATLLARRGHLKAARPADERLRLDPRTPLARGPLPALDLAVAGRLLRVGLPPAINGLFFVFVYLKLSHIVTDVGGDAAQAGLGVGLRGEQVAFLITSGFAVAATSLVARRMGAGRADDAARVAWRATAIASAGCLLWSVFTFLAPDVLAALFLADGPGNAVARAHAIAYWQIVAFCLVPQAWEGVLEGAFSGAGMTVPPMVVTMSLVAARVPLAWWLAVEQGRGLYAIWFVIAATAALRGILIAVWFSRNTWKRRTV